MSQQSRKATHIAVPLAGSCELQLSKGIRRVFRGVLGAVPVVDNRRAEIVPESHRAMGISRTPTLAQSTITERDERMIHVKTRSSFDASPQSTDRHYYYRGMCSTRVHST